MRRRPIDERQELDVASARGRRAGRSAHRPCASRDGGSASHGEHASFSLPPVALRADRDRVTDFEQVRERLVASVPDFLRSGIRGDTDAEVVFHVFLSFLHDAGRLSDGVGDPELLREALRSSLAVVDGMTAEVGADAARLNLMVSSGDQLVALRRSDAEMRLRVLSGKADADAVIGDDPQLRRKIPGVARMHFVIAASDFDDTPPNGRWRPVADCAIVTMSRDEDPRIEAL